MLDWPSESPDLYPIENLWSIASRQVYANGIQLECVSELKAELTAAWDTISNATVLSLVLLMPRICNEVVKRMAKKSLLNTGLQLFII